MKYINIDSQGKINNQEPDFATATVLVDVINIRYQELVETFGEPNAGNDDYKTDVNWLIFTPVGVATIYNWKNGKNYLGEEGVEIEEIIEWNIGAHSPGAAIWVRSALGLSEKEN